MNNVIDAKGLFIAPGFADIHIHADLIVMPYPSCESNIFQSVRTSLVGNCGWSLAPLNNLNKKLVQGYFSPFLLYNSDYGWDWKSFGEYYDEIAKLKFSLNIVPLVGQGTIRMAVKGFDQNASNKDESIAMQSILREALEEGTFPLSPGLGYPPGGYSNTEKLVELTEVLKEYNALFNCYIRDYGDLLENAVLEMIRIGEKMIFHY